MSRNPSTKVSGGPTLPALPGQMRRHPLIRRISDLWYAENSKSSGKRIAVSNLRKEIGSTIGVRRILDDISFDIAPSEKIAILGGNGAGKSTLLRIIGGVESKTSGNIHRGLFLSWPLGFSGGMGLEMTGIDNIRFIARLYGAPVEETISFVDDFAELGCQLFLPVKYYSSGMQMRLAFAMTLAIDFECFLIDEVLAVGDHRFHQKCYDALFVARKDSAMILISHDTSIIRKYCNQALVLKNGRGRVFSDVDFAIKIYQTLQ